MTKYWGTCQKIFTVLGPMSVTTFIDGDVCVRANHKTAQDATVDDIKGFLLFAFEIITKTLALLQLLVYAYDFCEMHVHTQTNVVL